MKKNHLMTAIIASCLSFSAFADANTNQKVSANVAKSCLFEINDVDFGEYDPKNPDYKIIDFAPKVKCNPGATYQYYTTGGQYVTTPIFASYMTNTTNNAHRLLFQVRNSKGVWQDDMYQPAPELPNNGLLDGVGNAQWNTHSILYRLVPGQYVAPGQYSARHTFQLFF